MTSISPRLSPRGILHLPWVGVLGLGGRVVNHFAVTRGVHSAPVPKSRVDVFCGQVWSSTAYSCNISFFSSVKQLKVYSN